MIFAATRLISAVRPLMIDACISALMQGRLFEARHLHGENSFSAADVQQITQSSVSRASDERWHDANPTNPPPKVHGDSFPCASTRTGERFSLRKRRGRFLQGMLRLGPSRHPDRLRQRRLRHFARSASCTAVAASPAAISREHISENGGGLRHHAGPLSRDSGKRDVEVEVIGKMQRGFMSQFARFESSRRC